MPPTIIELAIAIISSSFDIKRVGQKKVQKLCSFRQAMKLKRKILKQLQILARLELDEPTAIVTITITTEVK